MSDIARSSQVASGHPNATCTATTGGTTEVVAVDSSTVAVAGKAHNGDGCAT